MVAKGGNNQPKEIVVVYNYGPLTKFNNQQKQTLSSLMFCFNLNKATLNFNI